MISGNGEAPYTLEELRAVLDEMGGTPMEPDEKLHWDRICATVHAARRVAALEADLEEEKKRNRTLHDLVKRCEEWLPLGHDVEDPDEKQDLYDLQRQIEGLE